MYAFFKTTFDIQKENLFARKIIPKDRDLATVSFISYKVGCSKENFSEVLCSEKWPAGIIVKELIQKNSFVLQPKTTP